MKSQWSDFKKGMEASGGADAVNQLQQLTGLSLPEDLPAVFGDQLAVAVGSLGSGGSPEIGIRVKTDSPKVGQIVTNIKPMIQSALPTGQLMQVPDGWVFASTEAQARAMSSDGNLGESELFKSVVPDASKATVAGYVDLTAVAKSGESDPETTKVLEALKAAGVSVTMDGDRIKFSLRVGSR